MIAGPDSHRDQSLGDGARRTSERSAEEDRPPQLRARLRDAEAKYDLPVVAHDLKQLHARGGVGAIEAALRGRRRLHVRLGLARPMKDTGECYLMVNGVYAS